jgi:N-formylglutamate amidohydrolase
MYNEETYSVTEPVSQAKRSAFHLSAPLDTCSVMFSSPHSGRHYPEAFLNQLQVPHIDLRRTEDAYIDQMFSPVIHMGAGLISAVYARSYIDLNRAPDELDSRMFQDGPPNGVEKRSPRVEAGLGCIPRIACSGKEIYAERLMRAEADRRLDLAYEPYHAALANWLKLIRSRTGHSVLIECHSMPSVVAGRRIHADVILGTRYGSACDESLARHIEQGLGNMGYNVLRNTPYAGGFLTQKHGNPLEDQHAIQIEINRRLYLNEDEVTLKSSFRAVQKDMTALARSILSWSEQKKAAP